MNLLSLYMHKTNDSDTKNTTILLKSDLYLLYHILHAKA